MTALAEAYYRRLYAFHDDSPVIPLEEFYNPNHDPKDGRFTNGPSGKIGTGGKGGKVWTGVSADPDNRVRPKSKVHFPIEPDDFETQGEARARFGSSIYDADLGDGYQARVTNVRVIPNGISVFIKIRKGHEEVGEASRELTIAEDGRLIAHHETLYIAGKHQGLGIADRFNAHAVAEYQRLGVDHIDLHAGASVGGYAWARQGYRIFEGDRKKFLNAQLDRLETQLKIPVLRPHAKRLREDAAVLRKAIEAGEDVQPIHLASLGEKYARHTARDDHRREYPTWPGKSLLIGTTWLGQYYFDANRAVTAAATDLEHAALRSEEFYNMNHDPNTGRFATGGRRMYNDHGSWGNSWQGSSTITGQSADIMGISGYFSGGHPARMDERFGLPAALDETRKAQIRDAHDYAVQLLGAIHDATPFNKALYSGIALGAERFASLRPGDHIALPTTATSYDREFAHESGARPYEPGDMFKAETGIRSEVPVVLKFEAGTKAVRYQHNFREMITAGHFEVVSVDRVKSPYELFRRELNDLPVADAIEITLRQTHTIDPAQPITASGEWNDFACHDASCRPPTSGGAAAEEFYNKNHDKAGRFATGAGHKVITAAQARGDSRPVNHDEFQRLATIGQAQLDRFAEKASPITRLDRNWDRIKAESYAEVRKSWGGSTIDSHTGEALPQGANAFAITVKGKNGKTVSVHENASAEEFGAAMDTARAQFGTILARQSHYLGVFHDNDNGRIDIDPVLVVRSSRDVETIGAASHSIGGAFNFRDGLGYFPPHVDTSPVATNKRDDYERTYDSPEVKK